ncbi:hypothetical protein C2E31_08280, partial [Rhodopirellula baltica]
MIKAWLKSPEFRAAPKNLEVTVKDLEQRGLLQWDGRTRKYDLHPVVRGVASGAMAAAERERHGQRVVDHFTSQPHRPYKEAETLEDLRNGLHIVRTLIKLNRDPHEILYAYGNGLRQALSNLDLEEVNLAILRRFFQQDWGTLAGGLSDYAKMFCANAAAYSLRASDAAASIVANRVAFFSALEMDDWHVVRMSVTNTAIDLSRLNRCARQEAWVVFAVELALLRGDGHDVFRAKLDRFEQLAELGCFSDAEENWLALDKMGRNWPDCCYRSGQAEFDYARVQYWKGALQEAHLAKAERLTVKGKRRSAIRALHSLRGIWRLEQGEWQLAGASYQEAVRLARERSLTDTASETGLALAKYHLGQLADPREEAERLAQLRDPAHRLLAQLWLELGDTEQAKKHARAAYEWAWADGEPYVRRYELTKTPKHTQH